MKKFLLFTISAICFMHVFAQTTYTVSPSGTNSGTSYTTIKAAMSAAASGDIIQVESGTFTEVTASTTINLSTPKSLTIKGAGMNQTIIDGQSLNSIFIFDGVYTSSNTITLQDMTIQNGLKTTLSGGGIRFKNTGTALPTLNLVNLKITNNTSSGGGGVYTDGVALNVTGCYITGNIQNTASTNSGGGIWATLTSTTYLPVTVTIKNSTIANNSSIGNGAGISFACGANGSTAVTNSLSIENSTIYGNTVTASGKYGSGVYFKTAASGQATTPTNNLTLNYCTIAYNTTIAGSTTSSSGPDGVAFESASTGYGTTLVMNNSIIMGNSGSTGTNVSQIGTNSGLTSTGGKINTNPAITNSIFGIISGGTWVTTTNTFHNNMTAAIGDLAFDATLSTDAVPVLRIGTTSIAKDFITSNNQFTSITSDELGTSRDASPDAGAYENPAHTVTGNKVNLNNHISLNGKEINIFGLSGTVEIYNLTGKVISSQKIVENGSIMLSRSGMYILKINQDNNLYIQKILVY